MKTKFKVLLAHLSSYPTDLSRCFEVKKNEYVEIPRSTFRGLCKFGVFATMVDKVTKFAITVKKWRET